jgi:hypothetical protein
MKKRKYILTPRNENQEMNCRVKMTCTQKEAEKVAIKMAGDIQAALLMQGTITVGIQTESDALRGDCMVFATWDGKILQDRISL